MSHVEGFPEPAYRLEDLLESAGGDELLEELYTEVDDTVTRYWNTVARHEHMRAVQQFRLEPGAYREQHERLDQARRLTHNALVDKLTILARAVRKSGTKPTWWDAPDGLGKGGRTAVAQWALRSEFDRIVSQASNEDKVHANSTR